MSFLDFDLSHFTTLKLLLMSTILVLILRLVRNWILIFSMRKTYRYLSDRILSICEMTAWVILIIVWLLFLFWLTHTIFQNHLLYALPVFLLIAGFFTISIWFVVRDIAAGIILNSEGFYHPNDIIKFKDTQGRIKHLGYRSLEIETEGGERIKYPYSLVLKEAITKPNPTKTQKTHTFQLNIPKKYNLVDTIQKLRTIILNLPWSSLKRDPRIKSIGENEDHYQFEITVYTFSSHYFQQIEQSIKTGFY